MKRIADATKTVIAIPPVVVTVHIHLTLVVPAVEDRIVRSTTYATTP
jgi:hypothetical protein